MDIGRIRERVKRIGIEEKPENPKFSIEYMDQTADPRTNFYRFCNGSWISSHPIPEDKAQWSASMELVERNRYTLGKILEECSFLDHPGDQIREQVGAFYLSAMDVQTIEHLEYEPIREFMRMIDDVSNATEILPIISKLHRSGIPVMFSYSSSSDERNSSIYAYYLEQGGLSLPNREYYLLESFESVRRDYKKHISNQFTLYGQTREEADSSSEEVFKIELEMARNSRTPVELRDPESNYNRFLIGEINATFSGVDLKRYLSEISLPLVNYVVVRQPQFFDALGKILTDFPVESWKTYLKWKVLRFAAPYLHDAVEKENFDFFVRKLFGQPIQEKRWKRMVDLIDMEIGEALGKLYVDQEFGQDSKKRMEWMVDDLRETFIEKLKKLDWMSEKTREKALEKFAKFRAKIGYPNRFIDYSSINILPDDFFGNILRSNSFEFDREMRRVNTPIDRELWEMTPPTVNAYFSPTDNEIVFPAGILQPPFFDPEMDDAVNYGATGGTIAHEITHGFDDEGRKYDSDGNLNDWWSSEDAEEFNKRAKTVVNLYNSIEALPGLHINGELTLGENIADLGGISIAFDALERRLSRDPSMRKTIDGFTPEQRFYIGWTQAWRANVREETIKWQISNDPHSPEDVRGEIPARVHYKFGTHFAGTKGVKEETGSPITIW